jgi:hypothetical protein
LGAEHVGDHWPTGIPMRSGSFPTKDLPTVSVSSSIDKPISATAIAPFGRRSNTPLVTI